MSIFFLDVTGLSAQRSSHYVDRCRLNQQCNQMRKFSHFLQAVTSAVKTVPRSNPSKERPVIKKGFKLIMSYWRPSGPLNSMEKTHAKMQLTNI